MPRARGFSHQGLDTDVYISTMFDYHLCNLNVAPSRRNVKRSSVNTTNSVYMLWILGKKAIHQITESA
jgi:hypothetical protein